MSSVWKSSLALSSVPKKEPSQGPFCTTMRPHSIAPGPSSGPVNVSGRLSSQPRWTQTSAASWTTSWHRWRRLETYWRKRSRMGWPHQSEQLSCQGLTLTFRQIPQNRGGTSYHLWIPAGSPCSSSAVPHTPAPLPRTSFYDVPYHLCLSQ